MYVCMYHTYIRILSAVVLRTSHLYIYICGDACVHNICVYTISRDAHVHHSICRRGCVCVCVCVCACMCVVYVACTLSLCIFVCLCLFRRLSFSFFGSPIHDTHTHTHTHTHSHTHTLCVSCLTNSLSPLPLSSTGSLKAERMAFFCSLLLLFSYFFPLLFLFAYRRRRVGATGHAHTPTRSHAEVNAWPFRS
jgi:hypothetical protein